MEKLLELKEIALIPTAINYGKYQQSKINYLISDELEITGVSNTLPVITSPMESIIDSNNWKIWQDNGIKPILPRTEGLETRLSACCYIFSAFSIQEIKASFVDQDRRGGRNQFHICIDCGNGHDSNLLDLCHKLKQSYGQQMLIMAGNIFNPETYINYSKIGIDYVRVGSGGSLVNKNKFGFHYPMASLLIDINNTKNKACIGLKTPKIIADGGISSISDILKALALGADYVMCGRQFSKLLEAAGTVYKKSKNQNGEEIIEEVNLSSLTGITKEELIKLNLERQYYGNTSIEMQALRAGFNTVEDWVKKKPKIKLSDSTWEWVPVNNLISNWIIEFKNCTDYGFMMSGALNWKEFKDKVKYGRV